MNARHARTAVLVALALTTVLPSCGGGSDSTESGDTTDDSTEETTDSGGALSVAEFCERIEAVSSQQIDFNTVTEDQLRATQAEYAEIVAGLPDGVPEGVKADVEFLASYTNDLISYFEGIAWDNSQFSLDAIGGLPFTYELGPWTSMNCQ